MTKKLRKTHLEAFMTCRSLQPILLALAVTFSTAALLFAPQANASEYCRFDTQPKAGNYGGFQWYFGLLSQIDIETGKSLSANKAVTVSDIRDCPQVCLNTPGCSAVTYRLQTSGQCLLFAGFDFETNRHMALKIYSAGSNSTSSAIVRQYSGGPICQ